MWPYYYGGAPYANPYSYQYSYPYSYPAAPSPECADKIRAAQECMAAAVPVYQYPTAFPFPPAFFRQQSVFSPTRFSFARAAQTPGGGGAPTPIGGRMAGWY